MADAKDVVILRPESLERAGRSIAREDLRDPIVLAGLQIWNELRGVRRYPARADITPRRFREVLRNLTLVRVLDGGADYEFRIVGDAFHVAHGFSGQGMKTSTISSLSPGYGEASRRLLERVFKTRRPLFLRGQLERTQDTSLVLQESVHLPLGPDDEIADHILTIAAFTIESGAAKR